jgi:large subunit ribosomal protein L24
MKIKTGDTVIVTAGKDRGKEGTVLRSFPKKQVVLVEGIAIAQKHQKSRRRGSAGQILPKPMPIPVANVAFKDPKTGKPVRVGYTREGDKAKKVRVVHKTGTKL